MALETLQFGLDTFGDVNARPDGALAPYDEVLRNVVAQGVLADQVGIDAFGIGEHHRDDFAVSAPEVVLAAIAARTDRIGLGSAAVTVLSSDDPVRVYERFATLDGFPAAAPKSRWGADPLPNPFRSSASTFRITSVYSAKSSICRPAPRGSGKLAGHAPPAP